MNPRQRRGALLLIVTVLGAIGVFFAVLSFVSDVNSKVGRVTEVQQLARDVKALEPIEPDMLTTVELPERWIPEGAIRSANDVVGLVAATDYFEGATLQDGMMIPRPGIQPGFREVAIVVDAETGVAGKVSPGDHVDIIATIEGDDYTPNRAELWASNVLVLDVGLTQDIEETDTAGNFSRGTGVPVTFALEAPDAVRLAYIESFSVKLRLALRGAGDTEGISDQDSVFTGARDQDQNNSGDGDE